jgi:hypothetical protein
VPDGRARIDRSIPNGGALTAHDSLPLTGGPKLTRDSHTTAADVHPEPHEHTTDSSHASHARTAKLARIPGSVALSRAATPAPRLQR